MKNLEILKKNQISINEILEALEKYLECENFKILRSYTSDYDEKFEINPNDIEIFLYVFGEGGSSLCRCNFKEAILELAGDFTSQDKFEIKSYEDDYYASEYDSESSVTLEEILNDAKDNSNGKISIFAELSY